MEILVYESRNCTIRVAKTKALINFAATAKLICAFVFVLADRWVFHSVTHTRKIVMVFASEDLLHDRLGRCCGETVVWEGLGGAGCN